MKKIYTLLCIAATMLAACSKENVAGSGETAPQDGEVKYIDFTFGAEFPVPAENSKTMLGSDFSVLWCEGDQIAVNNNGMSGAKKGMDLDTFTGIVNPDDPHKAIFSGKINSDAKKFIAVYPSTDVKLGSLSFIVEDAGVDSNGLIYMILPNEQTAKEGSFTNGCALSYAIGNVTSGDMPETVVFNNLCAILEFTMPDYVIGAKSVNIKSNDGTKMSGGCVLDRGTGDNGIGFKSFKPSDHFDRAVYDNVTVTAPATASKFYAVIFPGKYPNGFTIKVTTAGGDTYSRSWGNDIAEIKAGCVYHIGGIGAVLDEQKVDLNVNIEQNIKTGSIATFNIAATGDFKEMVKSWSINLYNSDDQLVRKIENNTTGSGTLETVDDHKLLAAGDYYATVTYFMQTGTEREAIKIEGIKAPPFTVEGVVINATPTLNYDGGPLNGTDVQLSFDTSAVDPDLAKLINWTEIKLADASGVTYRTATAAGKMTPADGKPYMPKGTYTLTAYFTLPELGSYTPTKLASKTITVNLTPTFGVSLTSAKTSYDYYKEGKIDTANGCKNMGIYELAANVTGISDAVSTQMSGKFSYEWFLDSNSIGKTENTDAAVTKISQNTDNAVKVAFGNKNVSCKATFEGGNATSGNTAVDITGLPIYISSAKLDDLKSSGWSTQGQVKTYDNYLCTFYRTYLGPEQGAMVTPEFYLPASTNVSCYVKHMNYAAGVGKNQRAYIGPVSTASSSTTSYYLDCDYTAGSKTHNGTLEFSLSQSLPYIYFGVSGDYNKAPSLTTYYLIDINITYR